MWPPTEIWKKRYHDKEGTIAMHTNAQIAEEADKGNSRNTYNTMLRPDFRKECDKFLADMINDSVTNNEHLKRSMNTFTREVFVRSTIESVLRIEMMRKINPLACVHVSEADPIVCKQWGLYAADEGLHGRMFATDLHSIGVTDDEIFGTKPLFSTELLAGYLYQTLAAEGPLGVISSAYYVESVSAWQQPPWLDAMEKIVGAQATRGARAHLGVDERDSHVDLAWNMCMRLVKTPEDDERFKQHLVKLHSLLVAYVIEVADVVAHTSSFGASSNVGTRTVEASVSATAVSRN
jgi:hypothetical protein